MLCCDCGLGEAERAIGGTGEPAYIWLIHCPFDKEYYKSPETECEFEEMRLAAERSKSDDGS